MSASSHLLLEVLEVLSILAIMLCAWVLLRQVHRQAMAVKSLAGTVQEVVASVGEMHARDTHNIDELLLTQQVMLRRLDRIERRLSHGAD